MFDASILSDEATAPGLPNFTGAFVGMACQDLAGTAKPADFDWFEYRERDYVADWGQVLNPRFIHGPAHTTSAVPKRE